VPCLAWNNVWVSPRGGGNLVCGGCRGTLCVSVSGGETPVVAFGVLGDIGVAPTVDDLRREQGCKPIVGE